MGLLGPLLGGGMLGKVLRHLSDMTKPERIAALSDLANGLAATLGIDADEAHQALQRVVYAGEAAMLDTPEGRAVILQDAAELVSRGEG